MDTEPTPLTAVHLANELAAGDAAKADLHTDYLKRVGVATDPRHWLTTLNINGLESPGAQHG
jgi:hypothetical protein